VKTNQLLLRVAALTVSGTMHGQDVTETKNGNSLKNSIAFGIFNYANFFAKVTSVYSLHLKTTFSTPFTYRKSMLLQIATVRTIAPNT
jgi:hypothetical protein